jgi:enoyl-[acyl-carrier protein] reductase II
MERDTVVTGASTGHPVRVIKNKLAMEFLKREKEGAKPEELEALGVGALRRAVEGDVEWGSLMAGQISGLIREIKPVKNIIEDIIKEAEETIEKLKGLKK